MEIKKGINNILKIFKKDLESAISHPIVILTIVAIMLIPSLYALVNISACWDPYGNTGNLDFAIATEDTGAILEGHKFNIGDEVKKELKNNTDFSWKFVSTQQAEEGVKSGKYIAAIIIPKDFSKNVTSLNSDNPSNATIRYLVNDKNPLSSRMSNAAAIQIQKKLNSKIVEIMGLSAAHKLAELQSALASGAYQLNAGASQVSAGASQVRAGASQVSAGVPKVEAGAKEISSSAPQISDGAKQVNEGSKELNDGVEDLKNKTGPAYVIIDYFFGPMINGSTNLASASSQLADGSVLLANGSVMLADGSVQLAKGSNELASGSLELSSGSLLLANSAAMGLSTAAGSLNDVTNINDDYLGDFINTPVKFNTEEMFPVDNYGSEVAPFYLALSIWVGCIVCCVMLSMGYNDGTVFSPLEFYFGKQALFLVMALGQCTVTTIGSLILGFQIENIPLFILSMYIISVVFMFIIYSFCSIFGEIGKAMMLVVLVLQISATGGVYPVGVMDPFIQFVNPLLPMTHAIIMLKEACLGLVVSNYIFALLKLMVFPILTFILALLVKEKLNKSASFFEEVLKNSGIF